MTRTERIKDARERLAAAKAKVVEGERQNAEAEKVRPVIQAEFARLRKIAGRRPVAVQRPGTTLYWPMGMHLNLAYMDEAVRTSCGTNVPKWTEAVLNGAIGVSLPEGTSMKAKGFAGRARYISRTDVRKIALLQKREDAARAAAAKASEAKRAAILAAWTAGEKVDPNDVAQLMGRFYAARAREGKTIQSWVLEQQRSDVERAERHLLAMQGKGECSCHVCYEEKQRIENEARAKVLAKCPKVRFTCGSCRRTVVGAVEQFTQEDGSVVAGIRCPARYCGKAYKADTVKGRKVATRTPIGEVEEKAA